jgi:uncharacterized protein (TIGR02145 family)
VGTNWTVGATNYSAGKKFGDNLMLPAAGFRFFSNGALESRGNYGLYWSSTENGAYHAWYLLFNIDDAYSNYYYFRTGGLSVRCIAD